MFNAQETADQILAQGLFQICADIFDASTDFDWENS